MTQIKLFGATVLMAVLLGGPLLLAQKYEYCCDDAELEAEVERYYDELKFATDRKAQLESDIKLLDADIVTLNKQLISIDEQILSLENEYSTIINSLNLEDFDKKFVTTEDKIDKRIGTPQEVRNQFFDFLSGSKAKCLPKYYDRYLVMKKKLEDWEKDFSKPIIVESKDNKYTVVKGDCLWKIAGKKEIYNYPKYWVKIWEANKDGVISAPPGVKTKIPNPNLIYPGQVLKIPGLSDVEKKTATEKGTEKKKVRKHKKVKKSSNDVKKNDDKVKKDDKIKNEEKKDKSDKKTDKKSSAKKDKKVTTDKGRIKKK